mgnify:CR=1 FL=1
MLKGCNKIYETTGTYSSFVRPPYGAWKRTWIRITMILCPGMLILGLGKRKIQKKFVEENNHTYLIDWYAASEGHDEYFDADDTHLLPAGAKAYAKCIKEAVLDAYKKENIEIPKSRLSSGKDKSTDSSNDSSTDPNTDSSNDNSTE